MLERVGDLWSHPAEYRAVTTNGIVLPRSGALVMGAGVALQAKQRFPHLPLKLGGWVRKYGNRPLLCKDERILTFPTKEDWRDKSSIDLIVKSAFLVSAIVDKFDIKTVAMTRPGCGNGGLSWPQVRDAIFKLLDDRFIVLTP